MQKQSERFSSGFSEIARNWAVVLPIELKLGGERPDPITVSYVYFLLFERPAHLASQFVEKLAHGAAIQIASVLRKNLAGEDGDPLAMACGPMDRQKQLRQG